MFVSTKLLVDTNIRGLAIEVLRLGNTGAIERFISAGREDLRKPHQPERLRRSSLILAESTIRVPGPYGYTTLLKAGVDLAAPGAYHAIVDLFTSKLEETEKLLALSQSLDKTPARNPSHGKDQDGNAD